MDPIGFGGRDPNLYGYTFNDPVNLTDPSGKIAPIVLIVAPIATGFISGAIGAAGTLLQGGSPSQAGQAFAVGFIGGAAAGLGLATGVGAAISVAI